MSCPVAWFSALCRKPVRTSTHPKFVSDLRVYLRLTGRYARPNLRILTILRTALLVAAVALTHFTLTAAEPSKQPIAYPHKTHIALGLACLDCHSMADIGPAATIPSVKKCMLCHAKIATDKPEIKKLADYAAKGMEVPWVRVYGFEPHADVKFNHAPHIRANVQCTTCHGDMTQATTAAKNVNHNMGTCLTCHRQKGARQDCGYPCYMPLLIQPRSAHRASEASALLSREGNRAVRPAQNQSAKRGDA